MTGHTADWAAGSRTVFEAAEKDRTDESGWGRTAATNRLVVCTQVERRWVIAKRNWRSLLGCRSADWDWIDGEEKRMPEGCTGTWID